MAVPDRPRQTFYSTGCPAIGTDAKLILPLNFQEFGGLIEHRRNFRVLNGHRLNPPAGQAASDGWLRLPRMKRASRI
jgi:hypothetical protein